jgi:hypothetical protein
VPFVTSSDARSREEFVQEQPFYRMHSKIFGDPYKCSAYSLNEASADFVVFQTDLTGLAHLQVSAFGVTGRAIGQIEIGLTLSIAKKKPAGLQVSRHLRRPQNAGNYCLLWDMLICEKTRENTVFIAVFGGFE